MHLGHLGIAAGAREALDLLEHVAILAAGWLERFAATWSIRKPSKINCDA